MQVILDGQSLRLKDIENVSQQKAKISINNDNIPKIKRSSEFVKDSIKSDKVIYGINTGFGELVKFIIPKDELSVLQENLIRSHACAVAPYFSENESRAVLLSRLNCLSSGYSGVSIEVIETLTKIINSGWTPEIPQTGSLGASGDLGPLAHIGLIFLKEGYLLKDGKREATKNVLEALNIYIPEIGAKEGLALINGTSAMTAIASLNTLKSQRILSAAINISALSLQALLCSASPFQPEGHKLKKHKGQIFIAEKLYKLLNGSKLTLSDNQREEEISKEIKDNRKNDHIFFTETPLQDAYSLRCIPQILGISYETIINCQNTVINELNSVNDNPIIFDDFVFHGGNFHGQYISTSMDYLAISLNQIGMISERRLARMIDPKLSSGLSAFLAGYKEGINCGLAGVQYMSTSFVAENNFLASPVSLRSIPSNANNQDIVSMGLLSARRTRDILYNLSNILAIELIAAVQGINQRGPENLSLDCKIIYDKALEYIKPWTKDRSFTQEISNISSLILNGSDWLANEDDIV